MNKVNLSQLMFQENKWTYGVFVLQTINRNLDWQKPFKTTDFRKFCDNLNLLLTAGNYGNWLVVAGRGDNSNNKNW